MLDGSQGAFLLAKASVETLIARDLQQWFLRRKPDADCVVMDKFKDPVGIEEDCPCSAEDYEWCVCVSRFPRSSLTTARSDYNFAPDGDQCIPVGPEPSPAGSCVREDDKFKGSSGFRLIPGNTCDARKGIKKDEPIMKPCRAGQEAPGMISHQAVSSFLRR